MKVSELPITQLHEAPWNANVMDDDMRDRLRESIFRFGLVEVLVVRPIDDGYEVLGGNQRLQVLRENGVADVPCTVVVVDDADARLLAQALNRIEGVDDIGIKAQLIRDVLESLPEAEVLKLLPESAESLASLVELRQTDIAEQLQAWEHAQSARLKHFTFQLVPSQVQVVEAAMEKVLADPTYEQEISPSRRGNALFTLCQLYLETQGGSS